MLWFKQNNFFLRNIFFLLLIVLLSLPTIFPLLHPGFFSSDDGEWMIIRFSAFHQALVDEQLPVRMLARLNHEYGYPVANFLYPGFMYLAEIPKAIGFGFVDSIKIILGLSILLSAIFCYLWLANLFGRFPAFIGSLFYLYAPYHLFDIYKRGSVGELLALAVVPFILWTLEKKNIALTSLGIALLILAHNTLASLFLPMIFIYGILRKLFTIYHLLFTIFLGFCLSAFFWIPAIFDLQYTKFFETQVSNWQNYFTDLGLIGLSTVIVFILACIIYFDYSNNRTSNKNVVVLFLIIGLISIFLSLPISAGLWNILPVSFVQFPFRLLSITILCAAFLTACIVSFLPKKFRIALGIIFIFLTVVSARQFMTPQQYFDKNEGFYTTNVDSTTVKNEYMPKWVLIPPTKIPEKLVEFSLGSGSIEDVSSNNKAIRFTVKTQENASIRVNRVFFPGFVGFVNGQEHALHYNNAQGVIDIDVLAGESKVLLAFKETRIRLIADFISVAGIIGLGLLVKKSKKRRNK